MLLTIVGAPVVHPSPPPPSPPPPSPPPTLETAILLDIASTKTQAHVYQWQNGTEFSITEQKTSCSRLSPGLANFSWMTEDDLDGAVAKYLKPLTDCLALTTPAHTKVNLLATGGMRMVPSGKADAIWRAVAKLMSSTKYAVGDAMTISGNMEGVYAYLNVNNALETKAMKARMSMKERIASGSSHAYEDEREDEVGPRKLQAGQSSSKWIGVLDMGGASFQVAFTPRSQVTILQDSYGVILPERAKRAHIYSTSYQRYGQDQAIARYVSLLRDAGKLDAASCFNRGFDRLMQTAEGNEVRVRGAGDYGACAAQLTPLLGLHSECLTAPCAMNGVYQPSVGGITFYAGATLYYTVHGMLSKSYHATDGAYTPTPTQIAQAGRAQCAYAYDEIVAADPFGANYCFASAYIGRVLAAMGVADDSTQIVYTKEVPPGEGGASFDWARGAQLYLNTMEELYLHDLI